MNSIKKRNLIIESIVVNENLSPELKIDYIKRINNLTENTIELMYEQLFGRVTKAVQSVGSKIKNIKGIPKVQNVKPVKPVKSISDRIAGVKNRINKNNIVPVASGVAATGAGTARAVQYNNFMNRMRTIQSKINDPNVPPREKTQLRQQLIQMQKERVQKFGNAKSAIGAAGTAAAVVGGATMAAGYGAKGVKKGIHTVNVRRNTSKIIKSISPNRY